MIKTCMQCAKTFNGRKVVKCCSIECGYSFQRGKAKKNAKLRQPIVITGDIVTIDLGNGTSAKISIEDVELANTAWYWDGKYANGAYKGKSMRLHQAVCLRRDGFYPERFSKQTIDHKNRDRLDNTRANLEISTTLQNNLNTKRRVGKSGYVGVSATKTGESKPWRARHLNRLIGTYNTEIDAAKAYDEHIKALYPDMRLVLNFPDT